LDSDESLYEKALSGNKQKIRRDAAPAEATLD